MRVRILVILGLAVCCGTANAAAQDAVACVKPWAIPDKWTDQHDDPNDGVWTADDTFETVDAHGNPLSDPDVYVAPSAGGQPILLGVNIVGVFIDGITGGKVTGYITTPRWLTNPQP
jgi:hypothetical protein